MINQIIADAKARMQKSLESLKANFNKIRSGRAHPALLEHVVVSYYGNETPLSQVANINIEDARTLAVSPWDKSMMPAIEKAILTADLGLNPSTSGTLIRVPLPALTEQRRKEMVKMVKGEAEDARVAIRNIRRDANNAVKDLLKDKSITQDEERQAQDNIQKLTDDRIKEVEKLLSVKEADLMEV